ncbi:pyrroline-5-carboxylate reductase [Verrucomicrobiales bacterium BCK34]|nr:pyrroline-5-carboxylate reductase [Verrucomicrobiales bacterium BCK34]
MKLGVIGCGKMGSALVSGIIRSQLCAPSDVTVYDTFEPAASAMAKELGVTQVASNAEVVDASEVILLCIKPQGFPEMLTDLGEARDRLLISIAAGVKISTIEKATGLRHRVVRVMPNTPAMVGMGASAYALGMDASRDDAELTQSLLDSVGFACRVEEEDLDAVTAVSGSGPAYIFLMIEALIAGGMDQGLDAETAKSLAVQTVAGAAELVKSTGESPAKLRENVTSPNGTTFAALEFFRENKFEKIVKGAVEAAAKRSRILGQD